MRGPHSIRQGFTLVELLVVIAIIGILVALLLPAVQSAREAARRMQCQNNLKQLALACHNYHDAQKIFPPSSIWTNLDQTESSNYSDIRANWAVMILPYIEQQGLQDLMNMNQPMTAAVNLPGRGTRLAAMLCPSDPFARTPFNGSKNSNTSTLGDNWARGCYAANASLGKMKKPSNSESGAGADSPYWKNPGGSRMMGATILLEIGEIKDGTSNTILLAEMRAGVTEFDSRGVWAMCGGASALWAHGKIGGFDDNGPNCPHPESDDVLACTSIRSAVGGATRLQEMGMPCASGDTRPNYQQTSRSVHQGGVYTAFADGSIHFISDFVDIVGTSTSSPVWDKLNASGDGEVISASQF